MVNEDFPDICNQCGLKMAKRSIFKLVDDRAEMEKNCEEFTRLLMRICSIEPLINSKPVIGFLHLRRKHSSEENKFLSQWKSKEHQLRLRRENSSVDYNFSTEEDRMELEEQYRREEQAAKEHQVLLDKENEEKERQLFLHEKRKKAEAEGRIFDPLTEGTGFKRKKFQLNEKWRVLNPESSE